MRQELAFLSHLVRLVGDEPEAGYQPGGAPRASAGGPPPAPAAPAPHPGPEGVARCRDLLLLRPPDLAARAARPAAGAGHHRPQHRERVDRGLLAPGGRARRLAGAARSRGRRPERRGRAHRLGRRRPGLPPHPRHVPRPPVPRARPPRLGRGGRRAPRASTAPSSRSPSRPTNGINKQLVGVLGAPGATSPTAPNDPAARAGAARAGADARAGVQRPSTEQLALVGAAGARRVRRRSPAARRRDRADRAARSPRSTTRSSASSPPATPRTTCMDQRDLLLDQLSALGQVSVTATADGIAARRRSAATRRPRWSTTPASTAAAARSVRTPGGRLGALQDLSDVPGGVLDSLPQRARRGRRRARRRGQRVYTAAGSAPFFTGTTRRHPVRATRLAARRPPAARVAARRGEPPTTAGAPDRRAARRRAPTRPTARSWPASAPRCARRPARRPTPRRSPTRSQDRRESVAGVSLDEEMANLVRFQRAYQASSRAMSTMDEMLDVLINRTGTRWGCEHAHHHRHGPAQRPGRPQPRSTGASTRTQRKLASQPRDHAARPTTRSTPRARSRCARSLEGTQQYQRNVDDATGLAEDHRARRSTQITDVGPARPRAASLQGASDSSDPAAREAIACRSTS